MNGKTVLITGATSGIGLAAAEALARRGARLVMVARSETKALEAAARVGAIQGAAAPDILTADLASQTSVRRLAAEVLTRYPRVDVLINNAGAMHAAFNLTEDGVETTWAVNHLAPFLLTTLLGDRLKASAPSRVVTTAGELHRFAPGRIDDPNPRDYGSFGRYFRTKLANILFTMELARRLDGTGVTANCLHPGFTATGLNRGGGVLADFAMRLLSPFARGPQKGAETLVWLAASPDVAGVTGGYFIDKGRRAPSATARDMDLARRLWLLSDEQVAGSARGGS